MYDLDMMKRKLLCFLFTYPIYWFPARFAVLYISFEPGLELEKPMWGFGFFLSLGSSPQLNLAAAAPRTLLLILLLQAVSR